MATSPSFPFTYALVGAGRVGTAVARMLMERGNRPIGIASRSQASALRASSLLDAPVLEVDAIPEVDVVLIGAGDDAIGEIASRLTEQVSVVVHFAGAYGLGPLQPVIQRGGWGCALHPLQACPDIPTAIERLPGSYWGVTSTWPAREWAHRFVADEMEGNPVDVAEDARPIWHAAAVSTSNGIAALMAVGERLMGAAGIESPEKVLGPLARGTIENAIEGGGGAATLTGPAIRGETNTIELHLAAIRERAPQLMDPYVAAADVILAVGDIDEAVARSIRQLLETTR